jgi:hypothetical protein
MRTLLGLILVAGTIALPGCGGGGSSNEGVPPELLGMYTTTVEQGDVPASAGPELIPGTWKLVIGASGGPSGGPVLALKDPENATLEAPDLAVDGDRLKLTNEECAQQTGYVFYENEYSWKLDGSTLTVTTVKNQCPDRVAETILTSHPWTRQS